MELASVSLIEGSTIRFATLGDLKFLVKNSYVSAEIVRRKIEWQEMIVCEINESLIGFLQLEYLWSAVPYIALIRVATEYRRQGVGKRLLAFAEEFLRDKEHNAIYSSSQADEPEPQAWHRHVGFKECGIISGINDGVGEVFFRKRLT